MNRVPNGIAGFYPPTAFWNISVFAFLQCPAYLLADRLARWPNADGAGHRSYQGPPKHHWLSSNLWQLVGLLAWSDLVIQDLAECSFMHNLVAIDTSIAFIYLCSYDMCKYTTLKIEPIHRVYSYDQQGWVWNHPIWTVFFTCRASSVCKFPAQDFKTVSVIN